MAEIGNVRPSPPVNWPTQPAKITPADKQKDQGTNKNKQQQNHSDDDSDEQPHLDEYA